MFLKYKNIFLFFLLINFSIILFFYRDFLNSYRMMLDGGFQYYRYQDILYYYKYSDNNFKDYIPVNTRFLGIWFSYIIFEYFPCLIIGFDNIKNFSREYQCMTFSFALMNYLSKCLILSLTFFYFRFTLKKSTYEALLGFILSLIFLQYLEFATLDRISILYIFLFLVLINTKISYLLLIFSFLVNEKVIFVLGLYIFLRLIFNFSKHNLFQFIFIFGSLLLYFFMVYLLRDYFHYDFHPYYESSGFNRLKINLLHVSHISNSFIPILFIVFPFIFYYFASKNLTNKKQRIEKLLYILIPFGLFFLGYGGGENNIGRYVMYSYPIITELYVFIIVLIKKKLNV